ncbi:MAG TPA: DNA-processing protein DprA [Myxococcota bacterium]|nr:DNA-processing protein DprA [Myxococcota bacterium]
MERPWAGLMELAARRDVWKLVEAVGGVERAGLAGVDTWVAAGLSPSRAVELLRREWEGEALTPTRADWPERLNRLPGGPIALQLEGNRALLGRRGVAVVGARACTAYGRQQAREIASAVASAGGVVISGMAAGIDAEAHLAAGGDTIAVLGQGLRAGMAQWQQRLRAQILERGGLVVSEFPPGQVADRWTFPVRNRVIAALAEVVVVVEAAAQSGTRGTVQHALQYGRDVLAVPGPIGAVASVGCLQLIADGAGLVMGPQTVLDAAGLAPWRPSRYEAADRSAYAPLFAPTSRT